MKDNLKIQLRSVPYASYSHVLEYRIDPNQDITYEAVPNNFFGKLLKKIGWKFIKTFDTSWHQPQVFMNWVSMALYEFDDSFNWGPIWCDSKNTLENFKRQFVTYGDLRRYIEEKTNESYKRWKIERDKYLENKKTIY